MGPCGKTNEGVRVALDNDASGAPSELPPVPPVHPTHFSYSSFVWLAACVASQSGNRSQMFFMGTYLRGVCVWEGWWWWWWVDRE